MSSQTGECCEPGVDSAQWLFSQTKTAGTFQSCARLSDSWKVPDVRRPVAEEGDRDARLAAELEGERGADRRRQAAADDGVGAEVAALDVVEVHRAAVARADALDLAVELRHQRVRMRAARERVPVGAVGRGEDVAVLHRLADADRDRLLADRDVQEAGQLAGAEALLDLLLEAADQQHLAEEVAQLLVRERPCACARPSPSPGSLRTGARADGDCGVCSARGMALVEQWDEIEAGARAGLGGRRGCACDSPTRPSRAARRRCSRRSDPWRTGRRAAPLRRPAPAPARAPDAILRGLRRLDARGDRRDARARPLRRTAPAPGSRERAAEPRGRVGRAARDAAARLERPLPRARPGLERLRSACRARHVAAEPAPRAGRPSSASARASRFGYGASPGMVRRCLERCDRDSLTGELRTLRVLSDTFAVSTQGPVWTIGGRTV